MGDEVEASIRRPRFVQRAGAGGASACGSGAGRLLFGSSVFLVEGTKARVSDPAVWAAVQPPPGGVQPQGLSLDGMAYMRGWYPGDYAAITWLNDHIAGAPTIVEASNGAVYAWYSRVSIYTGLPDVWGGAATNRSSAMATRWVRQSDVQAFYGLRIPPPR